MVEDLELEGDLELRDSRNRLKREGSLAVSDEFYSLLLFFIPGMLVELCIALLFLLELTPLSE